MQMAKLDDDDGFTKVFRETTIEINQRNKP
jgi:hypothetical protein